MIYCDTSIAFFYLNFIYNRTCLCTPRFNMLIFDSSGVTCCKGISDVDNFDVNHYGSLIVSGVDEI